MKKSLFLLCFGCLNGVYAQFGPQQEINSSIDRPGDAKCYDLDGDGDLDILVASEDDNKISWYANNGEGKFGVQRIITTIAFDANIALSSDLDGDGDLDVFSTSTVGDKISWFANDGSGVFGLEQIITTDVDGLSGLFPTDVDGDGDVDLISSSLGDDEIAWFENDGDGNFGVKQVISTLPNGASTVISADLNEDGFMDVIYTSFSDNTISWFENDGLGMFGPEEVISSDLLGVSDVTTADIDNDGDEDIVSGSGFSEKLVWFENDGTGEFGLEQIITDAFSGLSDLVIEDVDNDMDLDVIAASPGEDKVAWFANDGGGTFEAEQVVTLSADAVRSVATGDLDGDSDPDIVSASVLDDKVAWYKNDGSGEFGPQLLVVTDHDGANNVYATDLDGDGDADVISTAFFDDKLVWYENDGFGNFVAQHLIAENIEEVSDAFYGDLDGDGDQDVLSTDRGSNEIAWYENLDGLGLFGLKQVISSSLDDVMSVYAADLDGDGDLDVLSASEDDDKIAWYENLGEAIFGVQQVISTEAKGPNTIYSADLDGDGDMDILSASASNADFDNRVAWYENDGDGNFEALETIHYETFGNGANDVFAADLDGDGDLDVLSSTNVIEAFWDDKIAWYENEGDGNFGPEQEITDDIDGANGVYAADLDGDGDQDVLSTALNDFEIVWYENEGGGAFGEKQIIWGGLGANDVFVIDLDGDEGPDVLSSSADGKIAWYENLNCLEYATIELEGEEDNVICLGTETTNLVSNKTGGVFSGVAVSEDQFDPNEAGVGEHYVYYTRPIDDEGCVYVDSILITIVDLPEVEIMDVSITPFCLTPLGVTLEGFPEGGEFWGMGVIGNLFTPSIAGPGEHSISYTFEDEFGCSSSDTTVFNVLDLELPVVNFEDLPVDGICINEDELLLEGTPSGGTFGGDGVTTTFFNPLDAGAGMHTLYYSYTDTEGCSNNDSINITVWDLPTVVFNDLDDNVLCLSETDVNLTAIPSGGAFSGEGVVDNVFNPSDVGEGEYVLYYAYEDSNGCSTQDSLEVRVTDCLSLSKEQELQVLVHPNPMRDFTTIELRNLEGKELVLEIYDLSGKVIYSTKITAPNLMIKREEFATGVYVLSVLNIRSEKIFTTPLIVE